MVLGGQLNINVTVTGEAALRRLTDSTKAVNLALKDTNMIRNLAVASAKNDIANLRLNNSVLKEKMSLSRDLVQQAALEDLRNKELTRTLQMRMQFEQELIQVKRLAVSEGVKLSEGEARIVTAMNMQIIRSEQAVAAQLQMKRRALMGVSISMFVLNISVNQLVASLKPLFKGNKAVTEGIKLLQASLNLALGPMQAFMAMQMIMMNTTLGLTGALKLFGGAMAFSLGLMGALTTKSAGLRLAFSALAGIGAVLAASQFLAAVATFSTAGAFATLQAVLGSPMGFLALAAGVGATAFAVGSVLANRPSAQTFGEQTKFIGQSGIAQVHAGERIMPAGKSDTGGFTVNVTLGKDSGVTMNTARFFAKQIKKEFDKGSARIPTRRFAANG